MNTGMTNANPDMPYDMPTEEQMKAFTERLEQKRRAEIERGDVDEASPKAGADEPTEAEKRAAYRAALTEALKNDRRAQRNLAGVQKAMRRIQKNQRPVNSTKKQRSGKKRNRRSR